MALTRLRGNIISDNSITGSLQIAPLSIVGSKLQANIIASDKIIANTIINDDIADGTIENVKLASPFSTGKAIAMAIVFS